MVIIYFLIALGILIFVHELGHFIMARRAGIRVEQFSIGFGPKLVAFRRGETEYKIAPIPLGGYVRLTGEDPEDEKKDDERSFASKPIGSRLKVTSAGPIMNLVLAFVLMPLVFFIGRMEPKFFSEPPRLIGVKHDSPAYQAGLQEGDLISKIDGRGVKTWDDVMDKVLISPDSVMRFGIERGEEKIERDVTVGRLPEIGGGYLGVEPILFLGNTAVIDRVIPGGPAAKAGVKAGDKVIRVSGQEAEDWMDMANIVNAVGGKELVLTVDRAGEVVELRVTPAYNNEFKRWVIGIEKRRRSTDLPMVKKRLDIFQSFIAGTKENIGLIGTTLVVLKRLITGKLSYKVLGGPVQIAEVAGMAAQAGLADFIYLLAFLSIQLGILNLLPIPVLDGGHIAFLALEAGLRKPVSSRVRLIAQQVGLVFILSIFFLVTVNDVDRMWGIKDAFMRLVSLVR